jgi:hypothetical protein
VVVRCRGAEYVVRCRRGIAEVIVQLQLQRCRVQGDSEDVQRCSGAEQVQRLCRVERFRGGAEVVQRWCIVRWFRVRWCRGGGEGVQWWCIGEGAEVCRCAQRVQRFSREVLVLQEVIVSAEMLRWRCR